MIKVLVTGGNGQLGKCFNYIKSEYPKIKFHFLDRKELDITDYQSILDYFKKNKINFIINCAAYTSVDMAEEEPRKAKEINVLGLGNLIKVSESHKIKLIHLSTDYVFNGLDLKEIKEDHIPDPMGVYGKTKLEGENLILKSKSGAIIIRTSWLFSPFGNNFVKTILKLAKSSNKISVINDQWGKPTCGLDLANTILKLIYSSKSFKNKIYHYSNKGVISWFDFAKAIIELSGSKITLVPIKSFEYYTKTIRPKHVTLNTNLIESSLKLQIPNWKDSLKKCLNIINEQL
tara:strand:- start:322 stop:1188 length:867 start_codon:yes stop_codon:yes gene_type:complete